jgi:hypothetical protein
MDSRTRRVLYGTHRLSDSFFFLLSLGANCELIAAIFSQFAGSAFTRTGTCTSAYYLLFLVSCIRNRASFFFMRHCFDLFLCFLTI